MFFRLTKKVVGLPAVVAENENIPEMTPQNHLGKISNGVEKVTHQQEKVHG